MMQQPIMQQPMMHQSVMSMQALPEPMMQQPMMQPVMSMQALPQPMMSQAVVDVQQEMPTAPTGGATSLSLAARAAEDRLRIAAASAGRSYSAVQPTSVQALPQPMMPPVMPPGAIAVNHLVVHHHEPSGHPQYPV